MLSRSLAWHAHFGNYFGAVITSVPTEAERRWSRPIGVTPPLVKNCMLRAKLRGELGLIRLRRTGTPPAFSPMKSVPDSPLSPSSKIDSKASVTFSRSSSEFSLLSAQAHPFFLWPRRLCRRGVANRRPGDEGGHPSLTNIMQTI